MSSPCSFSSGLHATKTASPPQNTARALLPFVIGWKNVKESDVIPGGDGHQLPFDGEACREWLLDRIDILPALIDAFVKGYEAHLAKRSDAEKK